MLGMLGDKNKKMITLILSQDHKPDEKMVPRGLESDFQMAMDEEAAQILRAIEDKDAKSLSHSLKEFFLMCDKEDEYNDEDEEETEEY